MAQWSSTFDDLMSKLGDESVSANTVSDYQKMLGVVHAFMEAMTNENNCLVWITTLPGNNIFGSTVIFVNDEILDKLQWTFTEWENGTAPAAVFNGEDQQMIKSHLSLKSTAPVVVRVRKKTTPVHQDGKSYRLYFHHDLPHNIRITVGIPSVVGL
jgi:hypothetical protein